MGQSSVWKDDRGVVRVEVGDQVDDSFGLKVWDKDGNLVHSFTTPGGDNPPPSTATLTLSPTHGPGSSSLTVSGTGFSGAISLYFDIDGPFALQANPDGTFSTRLSISGKAPGAHTVRASDGTSGAEVHATFTVDAAPPPPPPTTGDPLAGHDFGFPNTGTTRWGWFNAGAAYPDADLQKVMSDVMGWLAARVCPPWQIPAPASFQWYASEASIPSGVFKVGFYGDTSSDPACGGCAGYHSYDPDHGAVYAKVFTSYSGSTFDFDFLRIVAGHEAGEMTVDTFKNGAWIARDTGASAPNCYEVEIGDPVETQGYNDTQFGGAMTDFVLPAYFTRDAPGPYDFLGVLSGPFTWMGTGTNRLGPFSCPSGAMMELDEVPPSRPLHPDTGLPFYPQPADREMQHHGDR